MEQIVAYCGSASEITGNCEESARLTVVPSGYRGVWVIVVEDYDYTLSVHYATPEELAKLGLLNRERVEDSAAAAAAKGES